SYTCTYLVRLYSHLQNYWWHIDYVIIFSSVWQKMLHKLLLIQSLINLSDLNWVRCRKLVHRAQYNFYIHACIVAPKKIQIFILLMSATLLVDIQAPSILAQFSPSLLALYCPCQGVQNKKDFMQNH